MMTSKDCFDGQHRSSLVSPKAGRLWRRPPPHRYPMECIHLTCPLDCENHLLVVGRGAGKLATAISNVIPAPAPFANIGWRECG